MKKLTISTSITPSLLPKLANFLTFCLWLRRTRTISGTTDCFAGLSIPFTWLWGFMFVRTVVFGTATLVPCHTVPLGDISGLAFDCTSGGATATRKTFGNSISIRFKPFTVQVAPSRQKQGSRTCFCQCPHLPSSAR